MKYFVCAIWFITTVSLASLLFQNSVEKSDLSKTEKHTFDKFFLGVICFNLSCIFTTAVLQLYIQCREIIKLRHSMDIDAEKYSHKPLTKDWLNEIKDPTQEAMLV